MARFDYEGYLIDPNDWDETLAEELARREKLWGEGR